MTLFRARKSSSNRRFWFGIQTSPFSLARVKISSASAAVGVKGFSTFLQRETAETHESYEEELARFSAIRAGEPDGTQPILDTFRSNTYSHLSRNPLRNSRYLFVVNATMATRFAIEGGVPMETAYNISDLFIQRMDLCGTQEEI